MSVLSTVAVLGSLAATTYAHGHVSGVVVDGQYYQGYDPSFQYMQEAPKVVGWSTPEDQGNGFIAPDAYTSPDIICHLGATPAGKAAKVAAGGKVDIQWTDWPESHHGPVIDYLAKCAGDDCTSVDKENLEFFKIGAVGLISAADQNWGADKLRTNNNTWTATIPSDIAPGQYVLRNEIIALHSAGTEGGAQNYPMCISIEVTGSGSANPEGVKATTFYKPDDKGLVFNIYGDFDSYPIPGPPMYEGAASSGSSGSSSGAASSAPAASSATATSAPATTAAPTTAANNAGSGASTTTTTDIATTTATAQATVTAAASGSSSSVSSSSSGSTSSDSGSSSSTTPQKPSKALPDGFTIDDVSDWVDYLLATAAQNTRLHARDFALRK